MFHDQDPKNKILERRLSAAKDRWTKTLDEFKLQTPIEKGWQAKSVIVESHSYLSFLFVISPSLWICFTESWSTLGLESLEDEPINFTQGHSDRDPQIVLPLCLLSAQQSDCITKLCVGEHNLFFYTTKLP